MVKGTEGVLRLEGTPVTIKAGEKTAQFSVFSNQAGVLTESEIFKIQLASESKLPEKVVLKEALSINVIAGEMGELTEEQQAEILASYKTATGIDLSKYIGLVSVSTNIVYYDEDTDEPMEKTITGTTNITLSNKSNAETPVLKMTSNAMGIQDYMYNALRSKTVADKEVWTDEYYTKNIELMNAIGWNESSDEQFTMSLDNIRLKEGNQIEFIEEVIDPLDINLENDPDYEFATINIVPFTFDFSAYTRELEAVKNGTYEYGEYEFEATANPYFWLNCYDIVDVDEKEYESWTPASASIDNDALKFTFCVNNYNEAEFTRIVATYSPIN